MAGFYAPEVTIEDEHRKILIMADDEIIRSNLDSVLPALEHLVNLMAHRDKQPAYVVDINYYRRERERLIVELAVKRKKSRNDQIGNRPSRDERL